MIIYECADFEVIRREGKSEILLITFSSLGMFNAAGSLANGKVFWGQVLAEKFDYAAVGFVAKHRNWFCSDHMEEACDAVAAFANNYDHVLAYGSSMGGYASLRWGKRSGAATAIAFAPQISIDPTIVGAFDQRYEYAFRPKIHRHMEINQNHVGIPSFLFFDPSASEDRNHASLIKKNVPHIYEIPLYSCGHECIRVFARSEAANSLLYLCAKADINGVRALSRYARKVSKIRPVELANSLLPRRQDIAKRIFSKYNESFENNQKLAFLARIKEIDNISITNEMSKDEFSQRIAPASPMGEADIQFAKSVATAPKAKQSMHDQKPRLIHLHIPKTAGTALRAAFEQQFRGRLRIFPEWDESKYAGVNPDDFDFYSGHIGFETAARLRGDIVTVLRHPIDRFVSVYYFWRQLNESGVEKSINTQLASLYKLDDFVMIKDQPGLIEEFQNRCTFQLAYGSSLAQRRHMRLQGLTDDMVFEKAIENLKQLKVIGIQENMARFAQSIAEAFGVTLDIKKINVTRERQDIANISIKTRRAIQDWVYMDLELYQHARQIE